MQNTARAKCLYIKCGFGVAVCARVAAHLRRAVHLIGALHAAWARASEVALRGVLVKVHVMRGAVRACVC